MGTDKKLYITLDVDWASDEVVLFVFKYIKQLEVPVTFFITHDSSLLQEMRDSGYELGIHPNFDFFSSSGTRHNAVDGIDKLKKIVPEAVSVRCHSLTKNILLSNLYRESGFTHEANNFIPLQSGISVEPYEYPDGLIQIAHNWGDYYHLRAGRKVGPEEYLRVAGLKVLNFHPIHLFLNSNNIETYEEAKHFAREHVKLRSFVNKNNEGTLTFFESLVSTAKRQGFVFDVIKNIKLKR